MVAHLQAITKTFSETLFTAYQLWDEYQAATGRDLTPAKYDWLNSALIFVTLEHCRRDCTNLGYKEIPEDRLWCRFTLGQMKGPDQDVLRELFVHLRQFNPQVLRYPETLSEFLFDFSFTSLKIPDGFKTTGDEPDTRFQFLLVAESELDPRIDKVTEDLLRLVGASCPVKVMIFRARTDDPAPSLTKILKRCAPVGHHKTSDWLFLGVPTYDQWLASAEKDVLQKQVYCLPANAAEIALDPKLEWWKG
jgi:hypothetical protein